MESKYIKYIKTNKSLRLILFLGSIFILGVIFRWHIHTIKNLYGDEILTALRAKLPLLEILKKYSIVPVHYVLTHFSILILGYNPLALRVTSLVLGCAALFVYPLCVHRMVHDWRVAMLAGLFLALSPLHIEFSADGRYYSIMFFFSLLSICFLLNALEKHHYKFWVAWVFCTFINCMNHPFGWVMLGGEIVFLCLWFIIHYWPQYRQSPRFQDKKTFIKDLTLSLLTLLLLVLVPILVILPILKPFIQVTEMTKVVLVVNGPFLRSVFQSFTPFEASDRFIEFYVYFALFLLALIINFRKHRNLTLLTLCLTITPFVVLHFFSHLGHFFEAKYVIFILPLYLLFIANAFFDIKDFLVLKAPRYSGVITTLLLIILIGFHINPLVEKWRQGIGTWDIRSAVQYIESQAHSNDLICADVGWMGEAIRMNLQNPALIQNVRNYVPSYETDNVINMMHDYENVWIISSHKIMNNDAIKWYSTETPWGKFVQNPLNESLDTPTEIEKLNRYYLNVMPYRGVSVFELKREIEVKRVSRQHIGEYYRQLELENFHDISGDLNKHDFTMNEFLPFTKYTRVGQKILFERTGWHNMIIRYAIGKPAETSLNIHLDNQIIGQIDMNSPNNWEEDTVRLWINQGIHKIDLQLNDSYDLDTTVIVRVDNIKISYDEHAYFRLLQRPVRVNFDNKLLLAGYSIATNQISILRKMDIIFVWKKTGALNRDYGAFTHLTLRGDLEKRYQINHGSVDFLGATYFVAPCDWDLNAYVFETITLTLPPNAPSGIYDIYTGVFDGKNNLPIMNYYPQSSNRILVGSLLYKGWDYESKKESIAKSLFIDGINKYHRMNYRFALADFDLASGLNPNNRWLQEMKVNTQMMWSAMRNFSRPPNDNKAENINAMFGDFASLNQVEIDKQIVTPNDILQINSQWKNLNPIKDSYQVTVHLDRQEKPFYRIDGSHQAAGGIYPTDRWAKNETITDTFFVQIPGDTPSGNYLLWLGLYSPAIGVMSVTTDRPVSGGRILIGSVFVMGRDIQKDKTKYAKMFYKQALQQEKNLDYQEALKYYWKALEIDPSYTTASIGWYHTDQIWKSHKDWRLDSLTTAYHPVKVQFQNGLDLIGYNLDQPNTWNSGESIHLTYYWRLNQPTVHEFNSFTHVDRDVSLGSTQRIAPYYPVLYQNHPSFTWETGKIIKEELYFNIPANTPSGYYAINVGMLSSQTVLSVLSSDHLVSWNRVLLDKVLIKGNDFKSKSFQIAEHYRNLGLNQEALFSFPNALDYYQKAQFFAPSSEEIKTRIAKLQWYTELLKPSPIIEISKELIPLQVEYAENVTLLGYTINSKTIHPGDEIILCYYWKTKHPIEKNTLAFTHFDLIDKTKTKRITPQHLYANSIYPMNKWPANSLVRDAVIVRIPQDTPPGKYLIRTGLWDGIKSNLIPIDTKRFGNGLISVNTIEIIP